MNRIRLVNFLLVASLAGVIVGGWQSSRATGSVALARKYGPIAWTDSLPSALKAAKAQNKIVFVDFYAEWCGPCEQMLATTYKDKRVVARSRRFIAVLIDVDKQPKLAQHYGVYAMPSTLFLSPAGKPLRGDIGFHDVDTFLKLTGEVLSARR